MKKIILFLVLFGLIGFVNAGGYCAFYYDGPNSSINFYRQNPCITPVTRIAMAAETCYILYQLYE